MYACMYVCMYVCIGYARPVTGLHLGPPVTDIVSEQSLSLCLSLTLSVSASVSLCLSVSLSLSLLLLASCSRGFAGLLVSLGVSEEKVHQVEDILAERDHEHNS